MESSYDKSDKSFLSGTVAMNMLIAPSLNIDKLFIDDLEHVRCPFDNTKDIDNFSIARIISGKDGFYERFPGNYLDPEMANQAKEDIRQLFENDIELCSKFTMCSKSKCDKSTENCNKLNKLIKEAITFIKNKYGHNILSDYIITPLYEEDIEISPNTSLLKKRGGSKHNYKSISKAKSKAKSKSKSKAKAKSKSKIGRGRTKKKSRMLKKKYK